ncbi:MAG TPA: response regulator [Candidatus Angelobacter sp.]|nr:response regulator [Candidatus Angelobacter sp.]
MELKEANILLVEDEPFLREIMGAWLERVVGRVFSAENGREAAKILTANKNKIDLIISDVRMPVMDGIELLKRINASSARRPGMIFITGFSDLTLREAFEMGVEAILEKPIKREELLQVAKTCLADVEELWQSHAGAAPETQLKAAFSSFAVAVREKRIGFGRRGFCIKLSEALREGPVEFAIEFRDERMVLSGWGLVRWIAPEEAMAGIEITYLDQPSRDWVIAHLKKTKPLAFIPSSPGLDRLLQSKVA